MVEPFAEMVPVLGAAGNRQVQAGGDRFAPPEDGCTTILPLFGEHKATIIRANSAHLRHTCELFAPSKCFAQPNRVNHWKNLIGMLLDNVWLRAR
ncbi:MAG: hypothetical protein HPY82_13970 [Gammaproteobacteria bacterium]|nr:hypothetical protein [Gammaproteobacteria bacterium]